MGNGLEHLLAEGIVSEVIGRLQSGKEAEVFIVRYGGKVVAAKVYKDRAHRSFKSNADYKEGRSVRNSRSQRAMDRGSKFGQAAAEDAWKSAEVDALYKLHAAGVRVPTPVMFLEGVLLMELVLDAEGEAAPRIIDTGLTVEQANAAYHDMLGQLVRILSCDLIHGDLSPYNVLWAATGPTIIDFPQIVSASHNSRSEAFFLRDARNILGHFASVDRSLNARSGDAFEIWRAYVRRELTPDFRPLGRTRPPPPRTFEQGPPRARTPEHGPASPRGPQRPPPRVDAPPQARPHASAGGPPHGRPAPAPRDPGHARAHGHPRETREGGRGPQVPIAASAPQVPSSPQVPQVPQVPHAPRAHGRSEAHGQQPHARGPRPGRPGSGPRERDGRDAPDGARPAPQRPPQHAQPPKAPENVRGSDRDRRDPRPAQPHVGGGQQAHQARQARPQRDARESARGGQPPPPAQAPRDAHAHASSHASVHPPVNAPAPPDGAQPRRPGPRRPAPSPEVIVRHRPAFTSAPSPSSSHIAGDEPRAEPRDARGGNDAPRSDGRPPRPRRSGR